LRVPGVVNFHPLGQEALAPALPAAGKNGAAILRLHPGAETKLPLASALEG